ncbi:MAG: alpha-ketoglutarate-dependent dioxygenase AlkB [Flavobacteriaceae bacterium]|jgi:alkylated DNA repair dioxygenase AlkB|nr:alpha-ketoglutarate-dependent dioxygenase AlkB [Flavobacteriaceae bacterium]|tara:strand:+ start:663 stop:1271 length:609 start_codon:yes stop_codon:yes gene_type:complete
MVELIPESKKILNPNILDGEISYYSNFLLKKTSDNLFNKLKKTIPWKQDIIKVFGKTYNQPRLTSLHSTLKQNYSYSSITMTPLKMTTDLFYLMSLIKEINNTSFNTVLLNLYRDGSDSNGWHADNEKELGKNPVIASLSFGESRYFHLKHRTKKDQRFKIKLEHGSLLIMSGPMQHNWLHMIPKTKKKLDERINLTFRKLV